MTQSARLLRALHEHPEGLTTWDLQIGLRIMNLTGRVSDLRAAGHVIIGKRERHGGWRYVLMERPAQLALDGSSVMVGR